MGTFVQQRPSVAARTAILTSTDPSFRQRVRDALIDLRWRDSEVVGEADGETLHGRVRFRALLEPVSSE